MPVAPGFSSDQHAPPRNKTPGFEVQLVETPELQGFLSRDQKAEPSKLVETGTKTLPLSGKPGVFGVQPILQIKVGVGRPRQLPSTKAISRPNGRVVWRVLATINGKQRKKICATQGEAELLAHQWTTAQACDLQVLPTRLSPTQLREAEAATLMLENIGLSLREAANWILKNYQRPSAAKWAETIADYQSDRARQGISQSQISNVAKAAKRLAGFLVRPEIGELTRKEIEAFLGTLPEDVSPFPDLGFYHSNAPEGDDYIDDVKVQRVEIDDSSIIGLGHQEFTAAFSATVSFTAHAEYDDPDSWISLGEGDGVMYLHRCSGQIADEAAITGTIRFTTNRDWTKVEETFGCQIEDDMVEVTADAPPADERDDTDPLI